jgi:hypothetical protein
MTEFYHFELKKNGVQIIKNNKCKFRTKMGRIRTTIVDQPISMSTCRLDSVFTRFHSVKNANMQLIWSSDHPMYMLTNMISYYPMYMLTYIREVPNVCLSKHRCQKRSDWMLMINHPITVNITNKCGLRNK